MDATHARAAEIARAGRSSPHQVAEVDERALSAVGSPFGEDRFAAHNYDQTCAEYLLDRLGQPVLVVAGRGPVGGPDRLGNGVAHGHPDARPGRAARRRCGRHRRRAPRPASTPRRSHSRATPLALVTPAPWISRNGAPEVVAWKPVKAGCLEHGQQLARQCTLGCRTVSLRVGSVTTSASDGVLEHQLEQPALVRLHRST